MDIMSFFKNRTLIFADKADKDGYKDMDLVTDFIHASMNDKSTTI